MHSFSCFLPSQPNALSTDFFYQCARKPELSQSQGESQFYQHTNDPPDDGIDPTVREWAHIIAQEAHQKSCDVVHDDNNRQERKPVNNNQCSQPIGQCQVREMSRHGIDTSPPASQSNLGCDEVHYEEEQVIDGAKTKDKSVKKGFSEQ